MATSGLGPASAMAMLNATGSLSMRCTPSSSPASFSRTINDRFRCRSMATYCRSTGPLLARDLGLLTPSFVLGRSLAGEDPTFFVDDTTTSLRQQAAAGPCSDLFSESEAIALSSHHIQRARRLAER